MARCKICGTELSETIWACSCELEKFNNKRRIEKSLHIKHIPKTAYGNALWHKKVIEKINEIVDIYGKRIIELEERIGELEDDEEIEELRP